MDFTEKHRGLIRNLRIMLENCKVSTAEMHGKEILAWAESYHFLRELNEAVEKHLADKYLQQQIAQSVVATSHLHQESIQEEIREEVVLPEAPEVIVPPIVKVKKKQKK